MRMKAEELIDMRNDLHKFSVSWVTIHVVASPVAAFINAWNSHTIPGRNGGIPDILASRTCRIHGLSPSEVPSVIEAVDLHESTVGRLTRESTYGVDRIHGCNGCERMTFLLHSPRWKTVIFLMWCTAMV